MDCILFDDNFRLLIGEELDISAEDMVAEQRTVRFGAGEIRSLAGEDRHVLLVIADELQPLASGPVQAEGLLADSLDAEAVLTEAVARGWFHTVSAAASGPLTWTHEDSKRIGQLSITGRPSLGAFLAERRKAVHRGGHDASMPAVVTPGDVEVRSALMGLLTESGSRVQFGTADLAAAGDPDIAEMVEDISDNLRLALAVEEALAADLLLEALATDDEDIYQAVRMMIAERAAACRGRVPLFDDALDRLAQVPHRRLDPVLRRRRRRELGRVAEDIGHYISSFRERDTVGETMTVEEAREVLDQMDGPDAVAAGELVWLGGDAGEEQTFEEFAASLSEEFGRRAEAAAQRTAELKAAHPGADTAGLLSRLRREILSELDALGDDEGERVRELVMDYILIQAQLRGVRAGTAEDYRELGRKLLRAMSRISTAHRAVSTASGFAETYADPAFRQAQRYLIPFILKRLPAARAVSPGMRREAVKMMRTGLKNATGAVKINKKTARSIGAGIRSLSKATNRILLRSIDREFSRTQASA